MNLDLSLLSQAGHCTVHTVRAPVCAACQHSHKPFRAVGSNFKKKEKTGGDACDAVIAAFVIYIYCTLTELSIIF